MDITRLSLRAAADKGAVLHLKDPATGEELFANGEPVTITVMGAHCEALKEKTREIDRRRLAGEEIDDAKAGAEKLAAITISWSGIGYHSEEDYPCTFANAVKLYLDPDAEWVIAQIGPFSAKPRNFVKNRAES